MKLLDLSVDVLLMACSMDVLLWLQLLQICTVSSVVGLLNGCIVTVALASDLHCIERVATTVLS
jgi:hypothetical protein